MAETEKQAKQPEMSAKRFWLLLLLATLTSGALSVWLFYWGEPIVNRDAVHYIDLMNYYLERGRLPMVWYVSGLPFILFRSAVMLTGFSVENSIFLVNSLTSGIAVVIFGLLLNEIFQQRELAVSGAWLYAFFPKVMEIRASLLRENVGIMLALLAILAITKALSSKQLHWWFVGGIVGMLAAFCRIEMLELQAVFGLTGGLMLICGRMKWAEAWRSGGCYLAGIVAALSIMAWLLGGTLAEYRNIPDILVFRCRANTVNLEKNTYVPDYYYYK